MTEALKVVILGIVEGITEFLPISSTGHLLVASIAINFQHDLGSTFHIFIQLGAVLAVIAFYRSDLLSQLKAFRTDAGVRKLWMNVLLAFIPTGLIGLLLKDWIKANLLETAANSLIVAITLIAGGIVLILIERWYVQPQSATAELTSLNYNQALIVGLAQTVALVPGVSRSAAAIIGGMIGGMDRQTATRFAFYLAIPTLGIATIFDLLTSLDQVQSSDLFYLVLGTAVSAIVAWLSIGWLLRFVARSSFIPFGYYRIIAGIVILLLYIANLL
jgi:undecaprenyl-diphosphatase